MKEDHNFSNCKVGDLVTDVLYGYGRVISIDTTCWPINVKFENNMTHSYTLSGCVTTNSPTTLYHGHVELTVTTTPRITYKKGEWVAVTDCILTGWYIRKFVKFSNDRITCKSGDDSTTLNWKYHKPLSEFLNPEN